MNSNKITLHQTPKWLKYLVATTRCSLTVLLRSYSIDALIQSMYIADKSFRFKRTLCKILKLYWPIDFLKNIKIPRNPVFSFQCMSMYVINNCIFCTVAHLDTTVNTSLINKFDWLIYIWFSLQTCRINDQLVLYRYIIRWSVFFFSVEIKSESKTSCGTCNWWKC